MTVRLALALEAGLTLPDDGQVAIVGPSVETDLSTLDPVRCVIVSPQKPVHDRFSALGWTCATTMPEGIGATLIFLPRAKDLARDLISRAQGRIIVDGAKTDGVDSMLKAMRSRAEVIGPINKAHGKLFWCDRGDFSDWRATPQHVDGFETRAGVFSADSIDPGSRLLAEALPDKLGRRVADLGAGWGYLSAQILTRNSVESLYLVEADATALECAQQNVRDPRAQFHWADATRWETPELLDAVVANPPFHSSRAADPALGRAFLATASRVLAPSGVMWLVANRHLPYEEHLRALFRDVVETGGDGRYKIIRAARPIRTR
ncbi:MAG: class I SAM-dependent methyltransferase [Rhodobacteraceae bacterium]|nr:class I SAM-dependent methyltransferase [Paracoccaceae bacterium]